MSNRWKSIVAAITRANRMAEARSKHRSRLRRQALTASVPAEIVFLESRSLMATGVLGSQSLINSVIAGSQSFSAESDRSFAIDRRGNTIATWATKADDGYGSKIVARRFAFDGEPLGAEFTVGWSSSAIHPNPVVAAKDGRFVIAWDASGDAADPSARGVFARVYELDGTSLTDKFLINATTTGDQFDPSIAWVTTDRFVVAWTHGNAPRNRTVFARTFDATGKAVSDAFRLSGSSMGAQQHAVVAALPNGQFQAAWSGRGVGDTQGIFTRIFEQSGQPASREVLVTGARGSAEAQPALAVGADQAVIAWQASGNLQDPSGLGIFARRFDLKGKALGAEFRVNETTFGRQADPSVTIQENGEFVIAWAGRGKGDAAGVFLREFAADGTPLGGETLVNSSVAGVQAMPSVHTRGADGFVVAWSGQASVAERSGLAMRATLEKQIAMPTTTVSKRDDVMTFTIPGIGEINKVSPKLLTFTNTTDRTVYPILQGANSNKVSDKNSPNFGIGLYDPYDPIEREYRGYIGYIENGQYYLGLRPGETATMYVPLVFWDSGRILIASDGSNLIPEVNQVAPTPQKPNSPNPFYYLDFEYFTINKNVIDRLLKDEKVPEAIVDKLKPLLDKVFVIKDEFEKECAALLGETDWRVYSNSIFNMAGSEIPTKRFRDDLEDGKHAVLWYQAQDTAGKALGPSGGAPFQLGEMTYRSDIFKNPAFKTAKDIDPTGESGETHDLVNYDVSYVDSMMLPVAMQAYEVPLDASGQYTKLTASFGWVGANMTIGDVQRPLKDFTSPNTTANPNVNGMGDYFFGQGYPKYYTPADIEAITGIKVPAGQNLALESPLTNGRSPWDQNRFLTTSAGSAPIQLGSLGSVKAVDTTIYFASASYMKQLEGIKSAIDAGNTVYVRGSKNDLAPGTVVKSVNLTPENGLITVTIDPGNLVSGGTVEGVYDFTRPVVDYVMQRLANLWFSWADHYWKAVKDIVPEPGYAGTLAAKSNRILLTTPADPAKLVIGMPVSGAGLGPEMKATIIGLELSEDKSKVVAIRVSKFSTAGGSGDYTIKPVQQIQPISNEGFDLKRYTLSFGDKAAEDYAVSFARSLYLVMDSMNTIAYKPGQGPAVTQLMANVLGGNIGFVPNIGVSANSKVANEFAADINVTIRDNVKSILRGVDNFMTDPEEAGRWYPDPSLKGDVTGQKIDGKDATFNVYNLNPFVWFVHKKLGLSGYGFSLDDDAADVGADGASKLRVVIGNIDDLPDDQFIKPEWTHGAPYGPVVSSRGEFELITSGDYEGHYRIKNLDTTPLPIAFQVFGLGSSGEPGALVSGPGIKPGTRVILPEPSINSVILDTPVTAANGYVGPFYFTGTPPKVRQAATATRAGRQNWDLTVLGADDYYGEKALSYSWSLVSGPQGAEVSFAPPQSTASNALKNSQVVINGPPGKYVFRAKIAQPDNVGGFFSTSDVEIKVD